MDTDFYKRNKDNRNNTTKGADLGADLGLDKGGQDWTRKI